MKFKLLFFIVAFMLLIACSQQTSVIQDNSTPAYVKEMNTVPPNMILVESNTDEMDQGNHEYASPSWGKFVVDPINTTLLRGDVVYIDTPSIELTENSKLNPSPTKILRIVGLPGEKVKVDNGKILINDFLLSAFYGEARNSGMDMNTYQNWAKNNNMDPDGFDSSFEFNFSEIQVPLDSYFLVGDNWWRSIDSFDFGAVHKNNIVGKVMGYLNTTED